MRPIVIAPTILSADLRRLGETTRPPSAELGTARYEK
jgi:hypothetical protein